MKKTYLLKCLTVLSLSLAAPFAMAADAELMAAVSVMGYGYKVKITVNGADIGVTGGKNENRRLFNKGHEMSAQATPQVRARNFVLLPGSNEIAIEYSKNDPKANEELEITLQAADYSQPLLRLTNKTKASDKQLVSVNISEKPPANFKPVILESK